MFPLLLFLAVAAPHPCDAGIVLTARPLTIEEHRAKCVQYSTTALGDSTVVVYAIDAVDQQRSSDLPHRVFVAIGKRRANHAWKLSGRRDVTAKLLDTGELGYFETMNVLVNRFTVGGAAFLDVAVRTRISGSGGITATKDLMFRIEGEKLRPAATLETEGYARGGVSFLHQITSGLFVGKDQLVQVKRDRLARGKNRGKPLTVHCKVSRTVFKVIDGRLEQSGEIEASELKRLRLGLRPLPRFDRQEIVPCCAGCSIAN
ncbi:MAG: hypothetical protein QOC81_2500 [Thermoanaerobaculia bacterium]|jgi:hypothetical protein|nr:hypothetical protein [Thermoanaerobaculia bacterium]